MPVDFPWDYKACFEKDPLLKESDIEELKRWVISSDSSSVIPHDISEKLLLCFHSSCNLIMEDTKKCIKTYYSVRDRSPEHFDDRDVSMQTLIDTGAALDYSVLPEKTADDYTIIYHGLVNYAPDKYNFNPAIKLLLMTMESCVYEIGPVKGICLLFDMRGVKLAHLTRVNISSLAKFFTYIQEGMPMKIKKIYIMNTIPFFDKVLMLVKPFMKKELMSLLNIFPPTVDYDDFSKTELPKRCLPPHYGGDLPEAAILTKKNYEKLATLKSYFDEDERQRYAFSKNSKKRAMVESRFQDLNID